MRAILLAAGSATTVILTALAPGVSAAEHVIEIADYAFRPQSVRIKKGDTVRWVNRERRTSHSVLFKSAGGFESPRFFPGESWERRFDAPGAYPYSCGPHPEMSGVVEVVE